MRVARITGTIGLLAGVSWGAADGTLMKRVLDGQDPSLQPLAMEQAAAYEQGFTRDGDEWVCDNGDDAAARRGVCWSVVLNQTRAAPVMASAEAKAEQVDGPGNNDFSLYLDLSYMDGTTLWGQAMPFNPDPAVGWQRREVVLTPEKPIRRISYYLLFRNRAGRVRFRDARIGVLRTEEVMRFDGVAIKAIEPPQRGFLLRDVARESGFVAIGREALGVRLFTRERRAAGVTFYEVRLEEQTGRDRALTLLYSLPQPDGSLTWFHHPRRAFTLDRTQAEALNTASAPLGANGRLSRYPFGAVAVAGKGCAVGLDPATPLFFRIGCQPQTRELYLACDIGFAPEKRTADFRFCVFDFKAADGFRGALARYYELYPDAFVTRIRKQGIWMPFAPISQVEGWQDFGFRFKEGIDETAWDDAHDILTFRYTEPMTWWMTLKGEGPRTLARGREEAKRLAATGSSAARAWESSAFEDERGLRPGRVLDTPWCNGVVWSINSAPGVPGAVTDFSNKWNAAYLERTYGASRKADCDGEYIDSAEAYVTEVMNFRRGHFAAAERPLCYALGSRRVGVFKGMIGFEYVRALEREMRARGRYMMANSTPINWFWLAPLLDVMGAETDWNRNGVWRPMTDEELLYRRALCRGKPYCFLMNTDFSRFSYETSERFMKRALAYGMFPGYFSANASTGHYFKRPELYNRDRPLFKKYVPLCRLVAEAGWEPVTGAVSDTPDVIVERFGWQPGLCYLTVYNLTEAPRKAVIALTTLAQPTVCRELVRGGEVVWSEKRASFDLEADDVRVLEFKGPYTGDVLNADSAVGRDE
ncbi:MAG TPA: hypothetical protein P5125_04290 [Kiritimatiellia bacterium]|nr:hypothetical protein [Kiritimatiellia bacterium]